MAKQDITTTLLNKPIIKNTTDFFSKHKSIAPLASFTAGFALDTFTLTRIDLLRDNLIMFVYIIILGIMIVLVNFINNELVKRPFVLKYADWYPLALQFLLGGLFSKYVIFYFQSAAMSKNWIFLLLLVIVLVGNEFIRDRLSNLRFQSVLYFLASFSFFIFAVPVILKSMSTLVFLVSGMLSLIYVGGVIYLIFRKSESLVQGEFRKVMVMLISIYLPLNLFYF